MNGHPHPERYTLAQVRAFTRAIEAERLHARADALVDESHLHGDTKKLTAHVNSLRRAAKRK